MCVAEYEGQLRQFLALSSATTTFTPREHMPDWYWETAVDVRNRHRQLDRAALSTEVVGHNDSWLENLFGVAKTQLLGCWINGGRYWEAELLLRNYTASLPARDSPVAALISERLQVKAGITGLPEVLRSALCAPARCDRKEVTAALLPRFFGLLLGLQQSLPSVGARHAEAQELSEWSKISLDFVIAGIDGCGSTSLHRNLAQHPEIGFTTDEVDGFFGQVIQHRILPLRSQVDAFNSRMRPPVLGLCNPTLFSNALARQALALIPGVRVIIVVCDPLGRNEKRFMVYNLCHHDLRAAIATGDASSIRLGEDSCEPSIAALLDRPALLAKGLVAPHLEEVAGTFGDRLMVLHQDILHETPREAYSAMAYFAGASTPFSKEVRFYRYNSRRGHRTDLCRNVSLLRELQRLHEEDYRALEELLGDTAPLSLRTRQTRCDRVEELSELNPRCSNRTARCAY